MAGLTEGRYNMVADSIYQLTGRKVSISYSDNQQAYVVREDRGVNYMGLPQRLELQIPQIDGMTRQTFINEIVKWMHLTPVNPVDLEKEIETKTQRKRVRMGKWKVNKELL